MTGITVACCIAGGGPAGMMLGLLLARAGVGVLVLEKHADFLRDFRGDTIHPSTLEVLNELGLLDELLTLPHQKVAQLGGQVGGRRLAIADFRKLPTRCGYIAFMPQWDFLDFLARKARRWSGFDLRMRSEVTDLLVEDGRVAGVVCRASGQELTVRASLVVGADGRHSTVRQRAGLAVESLGAPMDVLWFRLSRAPADPDETMGFFEAGRIFVLINRGAHWQCGYVIRKGSLEQLRARGLGEFRADIGGLIPFAADRLGEIDSWDAVKLLTVALDRLRQWHRPGLLCIGDAAHAMSPIGGVGINLAIQDAVAAANLLWQPLRDGRAADDDLARVQRRRTFPTRVTQGLQLALQNRVIAQTLAESSQVHPPLPLRLFDRCPVLRRLPGRLIGMGVRPEHVSAPDCMA